MNVIKKYWNDAYRYVLLLIPGNCICAGIIYTIGKLAGWYPKVPWGIVLIFDFSQLLYLFISFCFMYHKKKVTYYSEKDIALIKLFVTISLFIQYNLIMNFFPTTNTWSCSFVFMGIVAFLFDMKLMLFHIIGYTIFITIAHIRHYEYFVPEDPAIRLKLMSFEILIYVLVSIAFLIITYLVERFMIQEQEQEAENIYLMEKQLDYYQSCDMMDREIRKFRHDIKGHFIGMEYLLENKRYDELFDYFKELNDSFAFQEKLYFSGNLIIDSILNYDIPNKCKSHVKRIVTGTLAEVETVSSIDLCTLFSNILSNAIRCANQCSESDEPQLSVRFDYGSNYFSITVVNSVPDGYSISKVQKNSHTLDRNHGYGLSKIRFICEKYDGTFEQTSQNKKMTTTVYLPL